MNMVLNAFATTAADKLGGRYGSQSVRNSSILDQVSGSLHSSSPTWKEGRPPVCCVLLTTAVVQGEGLGSKGENEEGTWRKNPSREGREAEGDRKAQRASAGGKPGAPGRSAGSERGGGEGARGTF